MAEKIPVMCVSLDNCIVGGDSLHKLASFLKGYGLRHGKLGLVRRTIVSGEPDELPLLLLPDVESRYLVSPTNHMRRHLRRYNVFYETL